MPVVNEPNNPVPLPRWTSEERAVWLDLLDSFAAALIPQSDGDSRLSGERREQTAIAAVELGARMADTAIRELQFRLYSQSDEVADSPDGDLSFTKFSEWLERTRPRRSRPIARRRR